MRSRVETDEVVDVGVGQEDPVDASRSQGRRAVSVPVEPSQANPGLRLI